MGLGLLIGGGIGAAVGLAAPGEHCWSCGAALRAVVLGILVGGVGFVVGTIVGIVATTHDQEIEPLADHDFSSLKPFARYPQIEPEILRDIR